MAETERLYTRREWMTRRVILHGTSPMVAAEAVSSTALSHPEWDMEEKKTMAEWEFVENGTKP